MLLTFLILSDNVKIQEERMDFLKCIVAVQQLVYGPIPDVSSLFTIQGIYVRLLLLTFNHYMLIMQMFMDFLGCLEV